MHVRSAIAFVHRDTPQKVVSRAETQAGEVVEIKPWKLREIHGQGLAFFSYLTRIFRLSFV
jgi:hypothetical protein